MALRIGQMQAASYPAVLTDEEENPGPAQPDTEMDDAQEPRGEFAKVSPESARYFPPEYRCGNCTHFTEGAESGICEIVAGPIDAEGVCSLHEPDVDAMSAEKSIEPVAEPVAPIDELDV